MDSREIAEEIARYGRILYPVYPVNGVEGRICTQCLEWKPKEAMKPQRNRYGGMSSWCKECDCGAKRKRYKEDGVSLRVAEYKRRYRKEHAEDRNEYNRKWRVDNPEKWGALRANQKAREEGIPGVITPDDLIEKWFGQDGRCFYCGVELTDYHVEHMIPKARGGTNWPHNICLACPGCNLSKGTLTHEEFIQRRSVSTTACPPPPGDRHTAYRQTPLDCLWS